MCDLDDGVEMEQLNLSFAVTKVSGGETCVFTPSSKVDFGMYREVWNSTHTILLGDSEGKDFMSGPQRRLTMSNKRSKVGIDADLLVVPYAHFHSIYAHSLLDFLPQAFAAIRYVRIEGLRILVGSNLQKRLLIAAGIKSKEIAPVNAQEDQVLCVKPGRSIHVVESLVEGTTKYYYHRMLGYRGVGEQVATAMVRSDVHSRLQHGSNSPAVVFLGRCGAAARPMGNEAKAVELVRTRMLRWGRREELVQLCGNGSEPEVQAAALRRAVSVIGPHGGAMSNLLYTAPRSDCKIHVVEFVQSTPFVPPGHGLPTQNRYKSFYYYGMGAFFDYKLVLMDESNSTGLLEVRLSDLEAALDGIWSKHTAPNSSD